MSQIILPPTHVPYPCLCSILPSSAGIHFVGRSISDMDARQDLFWCRSRLATEAEPPCLRVSEQECYWFSSKAKSVHWAQIVSLESCWKQKVFAGIITRTDCFQKLIVPQWTLHETTPTDTTTCCSVKLIIKTLLLFLTYLWWRLQTLLCGILAQNSQFSVCFFVNHPSRKHFLHDNTEKRCN